MKIIQACEQEENIAKQRSPLTKEMYVDMWLSVHDLLHVILCTLSCLTSST